MKILNYIKGIILENSEELPFSGSVLIENKHGVFLKEGFGYANRNEKLAINPSTIFAMASGCKIFTSVAISRLVEDGKLTFDTYLKDCLDIEFPNFSPDITIHHLLTHTSGIPDYFDEEVMEDFEELWREIPMYSITSPNAFLPMFQDHKMKFEPGTKFSYSNSGFIVLGLLVEKLAGVSFSEYIKNHIFKVCGMTNSGYYRMDQLPPNTALGYIDDKESGSWRTNIYSVPVVGGPDGGAFTTVEDLSLFWKALMGGELLSSDYLNTLLTPHVKSNDSTSYGYGVWIMTEKDEILKYAILGFDPGVRMHSSVNIKNNVQTHILSNIEQSIYPIVSLVDEVFNDNSSHNIDTDS
ncbi:serine hydrolase domain-containing protein [Priestia endophytica]|uniref:serine hydrolase domain-containing protein n=1 Tax=Priestia endophytica TaxID=135735 RepID=UPI0022802D3B|nr:serine hydrolase [Priestia endophytica]MCY8233441.1 beta-lactamase family protein [Priestia endophytica]